MKCVKVGFSKSKVGTAMRMIEKAGKPMRKYKCDDCGKYHLTSELNDKYPRLKG